MKCPKGHRCDKNWDKFKSGRRCAVCANNIKYTIEFVREFIEKEGYRLISSTYGGSKKKIEIQCPNKHITKVFFDNFKNKGFRCNKCHKDYYKHEKECREIFKEILGFDFPTIRPDFLKNPNTGFNLELDGYCEELRIAFEYDGEQHYSDGSWCGKSQRILNQKRDRLKDELCKKYGIILIRIPYWEKENKEFYIKNKLEKLNVYKKS